MSITRKYATIAFAAGLFASVCAAAAQAQSHGAGGHGGGHFSGGGHFGGGRGGYGEYGYGGYGFGLGWPYYGGSPYYGGTPYWGGYGPYGYGDQDDYTDPAEEYARVPAYGPPLPNYGPSLSGADAPPSPGSAGQYWFHCVSPEGYYPYVQSCSRGWQRVRPTPIEDSQDDHR